MILLAWAAMAIDRTQFQEPIAAVACVAAKSPVDEQDACEDVVATAPVSCLLCGVEEGILAVMSFQCLGLKPCHAGTLDLPIVNFRVCFW